MPPERSAAARPDTVRSFLSRFRAELLVAWTQLAGQIPAASELPWSALADHIPELLAQVAEIADQLPDDLMSPRRLDSARRHAVDRLGAGFDVSAVLHELSMLRRCTLVVWC